MLKAGKSSDCDRANLFMSLVRRDWSRSQFSGLLRDLPMSVLIETYGTMEYIVLSYWPSDTSRAAKPVGQARRLFLFFNEIGAAPLLSKHRVRRNQKVDAPVTACATAFCRSQLSDVAATCTHTQKAIYILAAEISEDSTECSESDDGKMPGSAAESSVSDLSSKSIDLEDIDSLKTDPDRKYFATEKREMFACASEVMYLKQLEEEGRDSIFGGSTVRVRDDLRTCKNCGSICELSVGK